MVANNPVSIKKQTRIKDLLEKLRNKLRDFMIINMQGQVLGRVKTLTLDRSYSLNLVLSPKDDQAGSSLYLLGTHYIEKVDTVNRLIFVDITPEEVNQLSVYSTQNDKLAENSGNSPSSSLTQASTMGFGEAQQLNETYSPETQSMESEMEMEGNNENFGESDDHTNVVEEEIVRLLEERLVVNRRKQKVGEVVVRKEIETQIIEVPIQREILVIEQVGAETKKLAEIDLSKGEVKGVELTNVPSSARSARHQQKDFSADKGYRVIGEFVSPKAASNLLEAIALQKRHGCQKVRVELVVDNPELQERYQKMFDRCSIG